MKLQTIESGKTQILTTTKSQFVDGIVYRSENNILEVYIKGTCYNYYCENKDFARVVGVTKIENSIGKAFHKAIRMTLPYVGQYPKDFEYRKNDHGFYIEDIGLGILVVHCDSSFIEEATFFFDVNSLKVMIGGKEYWYHCTPEEFEMFIGCGVVNKSVGHSFNKMVKPCLVAM